MAKYKVIEHCEMTRTLAWIVEANSEEEAENLVYENRYNHGDSNLDFTDENCDSEEYDYIDTYYETEEVE